MRMRYDNMVFSRMSKSYGEEGTYEVASYKGIALKCLFFLAMTILGAVGGLFIAIQNPALYIGLLGVGMIGTTILAIISMLSVKACKVTGTLYCLFEGLSIGLIALICASVLEGAVSIAILATFSVFAVVSLLFVSNIVKVNSGFIRFLTIFAISYMVCILIFGIMSLVSNFQFTWGITLLFSGITVFIATLYLFFDFR